MTRAATTPERRMVETCACHRMRMAARALSRRYDEALRPAGLRATQVALLAALALEGAMSIASLARALGMDRSTLTRNLGPIEKERLVVRGSEGWRRSRTLEITAQGRSRLREALPLWQNAQAHLRRELGARRWHDLQRGIDHVIQSPSRAPARAAR